METFIIDNMSTSFDRVLLGLLAGLAVVSACETIAVGALFYLRFTDEPRIEYRTETRYTPAARSSGFDDYSALQEQFQEQMRRLKGRIACLEEHDSHKYAPGLSVPC